MKKTIILFLSLIVSSFVFSQKKEPALKKIKYVKKIYQGKFESIYDTVYYNFSQGKLISIEAKGSLKTHIKYNKKGLVSEIYSLRNNKKYGDAYSYDDEGNLIKITAIENTTKHVRKTVDYNFTDLSNYTVHSVNLDRNGKQTSQATHTMKNGSILFLNKTGIYGKTKYKNFARFTYDNGNMIKAEYGKKKKPLSSVSYKYDDKLGIKTLIIKNMLGEKYFTNYLVAELPPVIYPIPSLSKNNLVKSYYTRKQKHRATNDFNIKIDYNSKNYPVKMIWQETNNRVIIEIYIEYESTTLD